MSRCRENAPEVAGLAREHEFRTFPGDKRPDVGSWGKGWGRQEGLWVLAWRTPPETEDEEGVGWGEQVLKQVWTGCG